MSMNIDVYCLHSRPIDFGICLIVEADDWRRCKGQAFNFAGTQLGITKPDESGEDCRTGP